MEHEKQGMQNIKNRRWLFGGIFILGMLFGLLMDDEDVFKVNAHECQREALKGFVFFTIAVVLIWVVDQLMTGVGHFLARVAGRRQAAKSSSFGWSDPFFEYVGWFFLCLGLGLAISAIWQSVGRFWSGIVFFAGGAGMFIGLKISKWLSKKLRSGI